MLRVTSVGNQILRPDDPAKEWDTQYIVDHMAVYMSNELSQVSVGTRSKLRCRR